MSWSPFFFGEEGVPIWATKRERRFHKGFHGRAKQEWMS